MTFSEWIDHKKPETLSVVLDAKLGTIRVWKHRNIIPRNVWPDICTRISGMTMLQLMAMEEASRVAVRK